MRTFIDSHRSFLLSITDINDKTNRESIEFDKNNISLFLKKEMMIFLLLIKIRSYC